MKKILIGLAALGMAAGTMTFAQAEEIPVDGAGTLFVGVTEDGEAYAVAQGDGENTPDGYVGVESNDGFVSKCNTDDPATEEDETDEDGYQAGEGSATNPTEFGQGNTSCLE